jgi:hypothetical protein
MQQGTGVKCNAKYSRRRWGHEQENLAPTETEETQPAKQATQISIQATSCYAKTTSPYVIINIGGKMIVALVDSSSDVTFC